MVHDLLQREDIDPEACNRKDYTPLLTAAESSQEPKVIMSLLETEYLEANVEGSNTQTALYLAAECGDISVVQVLLDCQDINPDLPDCTKRIPLS